MTGKYDCENIIAAVDEAKFYQEPTLKPIAGEIGAELIEGNTIGMATLRERYAMLTSPLPLAGFNALRRHGDRDLSMIATLRAEAPWMEPVIRIIEAQLERQLRLGRPWVSLFPMLLIGDPGCGKSWVARRIADLVGSGVGSIDLSSAIEAGAIAGNARGWISQQPCFAALTMAETKTANPVCILEEIDKAGRSDRHGDPLAALLAFLEPQTARRYPDRCLLAEVDTSAISWIMTANRITPAMTGPLVSRVTVIKIDSPPVAMFPALLDQLLIDLARRWRLPPEVKFDLPDSLIDRIRDDYVRTASIRRVSRMIEVVGADCLPEQSLH